ncbi:MAG: hypothetical protein AVDCRST_MAG49-3495, partial [uncultured Thermomicrobiales bacterium]
DHRDGADGRDDASRRPRPRRTWRRRHRPDPAQRRLRPAIRRGHQGFLPAGATM